MKSGLVWVLALSLCANGVLLAARWRASIANRGSSPALEKTSATDKERSSDVRTESDDPSIPGGAVADSTGTFWSSLDLNDLHSVVARLRAGGWPEEDVRVVVAALVNDRFKDRIEAALRGDNDEPFWKTRRTNANVQRYSEFYAAGREMGEMIMDLLGPEPLDPFTAFNLRCQYGVLPDEKLQALQRLDRDFADLSLQARAGRWGPSMPWDRDMAAYVDAEKRRDIEALLSPDELALYDLSTSNTSYNLRRQLAGFESTEAEFRALYALQRAFDEKYNLASGTTTSTSLSAAEKARPELLEQIKATLGEERFRDYERSTDQGFQSALAVTNRFELPPANATAAYTLAQDTRAAVKALNRDESLSAADRAAAMSRLLDEANARLDTLLTQPGSAVFRSRSNSWRYVESELRQKQREAK